MDVNKNFSTFPQTSLVFFEFLNQSSNSQLPWDFGKVLSTRHHSYVDDTDIECDGHLESDGHSPSAPRSLIENEVPVGFNMNPEEARIAREVAAELIRIADEFNDASLQAAERLTKALCSSRQPLWQQHLSQSVDGLLKEVPGCHSERVVMALTFSLVKRVCERVPSLLTGLYDAMMEYLGPR